MNKTTYIFLNFEVADQIYLAIKFMLCKAVCVIQYFNLELMLIKIKNTAKSLRTSIEKIKAFNSSPTSGNPCKSFCENYYFQIAFHSAF